jgi:hypothetical protein
MEATALIDRGAALPSSTGNLIDVVWFRFFCLDWLHICFIRHGVESLLVKRRRLSSAHFCVQPCVSIPGCISFVFVALAVHLRVFGGADGGLHLVV